MAVLRNQLIRGAFMLFILVLVPVGAAATTIDLGTAGAFNTFVLGNFSGSSDTQGRLAVGGNATLRNYSVADRLSNYSGNSLVVGGNLNYQNGRVYTGNVEVGGNANLGSPVRWGLINNGQTVSEGVDNLSVDFAAEAAYLMNLSTSLAGLDATGTVVSRWGGLMLTGDGESDLQVFDIAGADLSTTTWWDALASVPSDATILLNISGTNVTMTGGQQALAGYSNRVLFNFYEAETLSIYGISVEGSILAPFADIIRAEGVIQGTLVAGSMAGSLQQNLNPFQTYSDGLPVAGTPEPGTFLLLASALLLGLLVMRRQGLLPALARA